MHTLLTHDVMGAGGNLAAFPDEPAFVRLGQSTAFAMVDRGTMRWVRMTLGVHARVIDGGNLISHAREEKLDTVERWAMMSARRCALPVRGYRWHHDDRWVPTAAVWVPCIFEGGLFRPGAPDPDDFRAVCIADVTTNGSAPVLFDDAAMLRWLTAPQWEAPDVIRGNGRLAAAA